MSGGLSNKKWLQWTNREVGLVVKGCLVDVRGWLSAPEPAGSYGFAKSMRAFQMAHDIAEGRVCSVVLSRTVLSDVSWATDCET
jgi:hypothetical protein